MPAIFDQGARPTCLVASACDANQYGRLNISEMSIEHLFHLCWKRDTSCLQDGTSPALIGKILKDIGTVDQSFWPYEPMQPAICDWGPPPSSSVNFYRADLEAVQVDFNSIRHRVGQGMPVIIGLHVYENLIRCPGSGHLTGRPTGAPRGRHAMTAVAVMQNPSQRICLRNSWGVGWGLDGHVWLDETYFEQSVFSAHIIPEGSKTIWPN